MHILFGWGDNPGPGEMPYKVTNYNVSLETVAGDKKLANCVPGSITMSLELPANANPAAEFLTIAVDQHNTAADNGKGKISVFKGKDVGASIQEVIFKNAWIVDIDMGGSEHDEKFIVNVVIAASQVTVSGVKFLHHGRITHFS